MSTPTAPTAPSAPSAPSPPHASPDPSAPLRLHPIAVWVGGVTPHTRGDADDSLLRGAVVWVEGVTPHTCGDADDSLLRGACGWGVCGDVDDSLLRGAVVWAEGVTPHTRGDAVTTASSSGLVLSDDETTVCVVCASRTPHPTAPPNTQH
jgi:hypothetical protein